MSPDFLLVVVLEYLMLHIHVCDIRGVGTQSNHVEVTSTPVLPSPEITLFSQHVIGFPVTNVSSTGR